jgi:hypothetical protein
VDVAWVAPAGGADKIRMTVRRLPASEQHRDTAHVTAAGATLSRRQRRASVATAPRGPAPRSTSAGPSRHRGGSPGTPSRRHVAGGAVDGVDGCLYTRLVRGSATSTRVSGLSPATSYELQAWSIGAAGPASTPSHTLVVTTRPVPAPVVVPLTWERGGREF